MMEAGLLLNLGVTTVVQASIGAIITVIIRRYAATVDKLAGRVTELEERRLVSIERAWQSNAAEHQKMKDAIAGRMSREDQTDLVSRIERVTDKQDATAVQQTETATKMTIATEQIGELFGRMTILTRDVARMQGKIEP